MTLIQPQFGAIRFYRPKETPEKLAMYFFPPTPDSEISDDQILGPEGEDWGQSELAMNPLPNMDQRNLRLRLISLASRQDCGEAKSNIPLSVLQAMKSKDYSLRTTGPQSNPWSVVTFPESVFVDA